MTEAKKSMFEKLSQINVSQYVEKKGKFSYLSWAWAIQELLTVAPEATWIVHEWGIEGNRQPYQQTEAGCFVKVTVTVNDIDRSQVHPVLDNTNKSIMAPNAFDINTSIMRCLTKAISLHGLGLYIYAGEDLPIDDGKSEQKTKPKTAQPKKSVITGHNPNMKNGEDKMTESQRNYIFSLREDWMKELGSEEAIKELDKLDKSQTKRGLC